MFPECHICFSEVTWNDKDRHFMWSLWVRNMIIMGAFACAQSSAPNTSTVPFCLNMGMSTVLVKRFVRCCSFSVQLKQASLEACSHCGGEVDDVKNVNNSGHSPGISCHKCTTRKVAVVHSCIKMFWRYGDRVGGFRACVLRCEPLREKTLICADEL